MAKIAICDKCGKVMAEIENQKIKGETYNIRIYRGTVKMKSMELCKECADKIIKELE